MPFSLLHPREQLSAIMGRIYRQDMTTLTGGNLSIRDEAGDLWITPSGIDKGALRPQDIMCVRADGTVKGPHRPSSELPFHTAIYRRRPDLRAIVHAHSRALVTFSMLRTVPDTRVLPQAYRVCGPVGYAPYAMMSSDQLAVNVAAVFAEGHNAALFENHSGATGGADLLQAFQRFETLDFCARTLIHAYGLVKPTGDTPIRTLDDHQLALSSGRPDPLPEFVPTHHSSHERELRQQVVEIVRRAYDRCLMTSTQGVISARVGEDDFLITPTAVSAEGGPADRAAIGLADVARVFKGRREAGKWPSRSARLHRAIYQQHPEIGSVITAQAPHITAYALVPQAFDTKTIPESYVILRHLAKIDFEPFYRGLLGREQRAVAARLSPRTPALIVENEGLLATGATILQAFDRLEIAEYSAQSLIDITAKVGEWTPLEEPRLRELEAAFGLK
jgi:L-fuculose-phosphate aldolase